jgi:putative hydrolase of HD superfamily
MTNDQHDEGTVAFLYEAGHLKRTRRSGWQIPGITTPESVAEHSYRTAVIAFVLAVMEGADPNRAAALAVFHDVPETRIGDIPSIGRAFLTAAPAKDVIAAQTAAAHPDVAEAVQDAIGEFEAKSTLEARCAKDADKLECLLQAREYQAAGHGDVQPWIDTMLTAVSTESGKRLAEQAVTTAPSVWWLETVSNYGKNPPTSGTLA